MAKLDVYLWDEKIGVVSWNADTLSAPFAYDPSFIRTGIEISPIAMPLSNEVYNFNSLPRGTFQGLPGVLADSLPDKFGQALIRTYFQTKGYVFDDLDPTDKLAYIGRRGMGALEYRPAKDIPQIDKGIAIEELKSLARFGLRTAEQLDTHIGENESQGFQDILSIGTSAGGARAKAVIAYNEKTGELRSGQLDHGEGFAHWIIKLDVAKGSEVLDKPQGYGCVEYTYYQIAKLGGVPMNECRLMQDKDRAHFMTKRFDREGKDRHHVATLTGLRHIDYEDVGSHSYNQLFETARYLGVPYKDMEQLYRQMVFNVVMVNCDDHTKNFGFMLHKDDPKQWRATPAYDLAYSYDQGNLWVKDHMMIQGKRSDITFKDLISEGEKHGIRKPKELILEVVEASTKWEELAIANKVPPEMMRKIQKRLNEVYHSLELHTIHTKV